MSKQFRRRFISLAIVVSMIVSMLSFGGIQASAAANTSLVVLLSDYAVNLTVGGADVDVDVDFLVGNLDNILGKADPIQWTSAYIVEAVSSNDNVVDVSFATSDESPITLEPVGKGTAIVTVTVKAPTTVGHVHKDLEGTAVIVVTVDDSSDVLKILAGDTGVIIQPMPALTAAQSTYEYKYTATLEKVTSLPTLGTTVLGNGSAGSTYHDDTGNGQVGGKDIAENTDSDPIFGDIADPSTSTVVGKLANDERYWFQVYLVNGSGVIQNFWQVRAGAEGSEVDVITLNPTALLIDSFVPGTPKTGFVNIAEVLSNLSSDNEITFFTWEASSADTSKVRVAASGDQSTPNIAVTAISPIGSTPVAVTVTVSATLRGVRKSKTVTFDVTSTSAESDNKIAPNGFITVLGQYASLAINGVDDVYRVTLPHDTVIPNGSDLSDLLTSHIFVKPNSDLVLTNSSDWITIAKTSGSSLNAEYSIVVTAEDKTSKAYKLFITLEEDPDVVAVRKATAIIKPGLADAAVEITAQIFAATAGHQTILDEAAKVLKALIVAKDPSLGDIIVTVAHAASAYNVKLSHGSNTGMTAIPLTVTGTTSTNDSRLLTAWTNISAANIKIPVNLIDAPGDNDTTLTSKKNGRLAYIKAEAEKVVSSSIDVTVIDYDPLTDEYLVTLKLKPVNATSPTAVYVLKVGKETVPPTLSSDAGIDNITVKGKVAERIMIGSGGSATATDNFRIELAFGSVPDLAVGNLPLTDIFVLTSGKSTAVVSAEGTIASGAREAIYNVVVTAENGAKKTYKLFVSIARDPDLIALDKAAALIGTSIDITKQTFDAGNTTNIATEAAAAIKAEIAKDPLLPNITVAVTSVNLATGTCTVTLSFNSKSAPAITGFILKRHETDRSKVLTAWADIDAATIEIPSSVWADSTKDIIRDGTYGILKQLNDIVSGSIHVAVFPYDLSARQYRVVLTLTSNVEATLTDIITVTHLPRPPAPDDDISIESITVAGVKARLDISQGNIHTYESKLPHTTVGIDNLSTDLTISGTPNVIVSTSAATSTFAITRVRASQYEAVYDIVVTAENGDTQLYRLFVTLEENPADVALRKARTIIGNSVDITKQTLDGGNATTINAEAVAAIQAKLRAIDPSLPVITVTSAFASNPKTVTINTANSSGAVTFTIAFNSSTVTDLARISDAWKIIAYAEIMIPLATHTQNGVNAATILTDKQNYIKTQANLLLAAKNLDSVVDIDTVQLYDAAKKQYLVYLTSNNVSDIWVLNVDYELQAKGTGAGSNSSDTASGVEIRYSTGGKFVTGDDTPRVGDKLHVFIELSNGDFMVGRLDNGIYKTPVAYNKYSDNAGAEIIYRWFLEESPANIEYGPIYTVQQSDNGKTLKLTVIVKSGSTIKEYYPASITIGKIAEIKDVEIVDNTSGKAVTGTPFVGQTLKANLDVPTGTVITAGSIVNYTWKADGRVVGTNSTYQIKPEDFNTTISVEVTSDTLLAALVVKSDTLSNKVVGFKEIGIYDAVGEGSFEVVTPVVHQTLFARILMPDGSFIETAPLGEFLSYRWYHEGDTTKTPLSETSTYTVQESDRGKKISVDIVKGLHADTATTNNVPLEAIIIDKTAVIGTRVVDVDSDSVPKAAVTLPTVGDKLGVEIKLNGNSYDIINLYREDGSVVNGRNQKVAGVTYEWQRLKNGSTTRLSTDATYTVLQRDIGEVLQVKITLTRSFPGTATGTDALTFTYVIGEVQAPAALEINRLIIVNTEKEAKEEGFQIIAPAVGYELGVEINATLSGIAGDYKLYNSRTHNNFKTESSPTKYKLTVNGVSGRDEEVEVKFRWFDVDNTNTSTNTLGTTPIYVVTEADFEAGRLIGVEVTLERPVKIDNEIVKVVESGQARGRVQEGTTPGASGIDYEYERRLEVTGKATKGGVAVELDCVIDLWEETLELPASYFVKAFSTDGGTKWRKGRPTHNISKLLNKDLNLVLSDNLDPNSAEATLVRFAPIKRRQKMEKYEINYVFGADSSGITRGTWVMSERGKSDPVTHLEVSLSRGNKPGEWGRFVFPENPTDAYKGGIAIVSESSASGSRKINYFVREAAVNHPTEGFMAASKARKLTVMVESKTPKYKTNKTNEFKIKADTWVVYSVEITANGGGTALEHLPARLYGKGDIIPATNNMGTITAMWYAAGKKPASDWQTFEIE